MNKKITLMLVAIISTLSTIAQSIAPIESTEFCPNTNINFSVTLPRIENNTTPSVLSWTNGPTVISGASNIVNTTNQTTFTFVGKFQDRNLMQVFKIDYITTNSSGTNVSNTYLANFKRIKSLYFQIAQSLTNTPCPKVQADQSTVSVALCQIVNIPISCNNISWGTFGESPEFYKKLDELFK